MVKVLFVCMGNICRSPTAQGVFERMVSEAGLAEFVQIDSAGTHAYHVGEPPDRRAQAAARKRGYDLSAQRARRISPLDFASYDYVLVMDEDNLADARSSCPPEHAHKLALLMHYAPEHGLREVPDPYYGGESGFDRVLDMVEAASRGLLAEISRRLG